MGMMTKLDVWNIFSCYLRLEGADTTYTYLKKSPRFSLRALSKSIIRKSISICKREREATWSTINQIGTRRVSRDGLERKQVWQQTLGRRQFSEEKAKTVTAEIPHLQERVTISLRDAYPAWWPAEVGNPLDVAHLEFPSIMMATWLGNNSLRSLEGSCCCCSCSCSCSSSSSSFIRPCLCRWWWSTDTASSAE